MILDIDPKVDYAFKHLLGRDSTRDILADVIEQVLDPDPRYHIRDIELLNPFNPKEAFDDKLSILDVKARDQSGRQFNVEMQMLPSRYYDKRIVYYWARLHQQQLHEGEDYLTLMPTISISFLNHVLFPEAAEYHLRFRLLEQSQHFPLTDDMEFHILELPKFTKTLPQLTSGLDVWLYFLRHAEKIDMDNVPAELQKPLVLRALGELVMLNQTDLERERYEARRKAQLDYNTAIKASRMEGEEVGLKRGEKIGMERGEKIGMIGTIHLCESLLNRPVTPREQLANLPLEELMRLADELKATLLKK